MLVIVDPNSFSISLCSGQREAGRVGQTEKGDERDTQSTLATKVTYPDPDKVCDHR